MRCNTQTERIKTAYMQTTKVITIIITAGGGREPTTYCRDSAQCTHTDTEAQTGKRERGKLRLD